MSDKAKTDWAKWAVYAQLASDLSSGVGDLYEQIDRLQTVVTQLALAVQDLERRMAEVEQRKLSA